MKITARMGEGNLSSEKNDHPLGGATLSAPHGVLVWQFAA